MVPASVRSFDTVLKEQPTDRAVARIDIPSHRSLMTIARFGAARRFMLLR